jgi:hypothetical protein
MMGLLAAIAGLGSWPMCFSVDCLQTRALFGSPFVARQPFF